jgi:hypothetical protein
MMRPIQAYFGGPRTFRSFSARHAASPSGGAGRAGIRGPQGATDRHAGVPVYRYRLLTKPGFEYVSPSSTRITGYPPEDYYADPDLDFEPVHPEDRYLLGAPGA